jgi:hypothetical protein
MIQRTFQGGFGLLTGCTYLVEITDDKLSAPKYYSIQEYYDNDCLELFIDEEPFGRNHQNKLSMPLPTI